MNIEEILKNPYIASIMQRQALRLSVYGRGNVLRADIIDGEAKIVSNLTGRTFDTIDEAMSAARADEVTELVRITTGRTRTADRFGAVSGMLSGLKREMASDPVQLRQRLASLGVDMGGQDFADISINLLNYKPTEKKSLKYLAQDLMEKRNKSDLFGIPVTDDEGVRLIQFVLNPNDRGEGITLTESQSHRLLASYKRSFADYDTIMGIFSGSDPGRSGVKLMETLGKLVKRIRGDFSEREISLSGENLSDFLGARGARLAPSSLQEGLLLTNRKYEMMLKYFVGDAKFEEALSRVYVNQPERNAGDLAKFYRNQNARDLVGALLDKYGSIEMESPGGRKFKATRNARKELTIWMKQNIETIGAGSSSLLRSDVLADEIASSSLSAEAKELFEKVFSGIEYSDDGTSLGNVNHMRAYVAGISNDIRQITSEIASGSFTGDDLTNKQARLRQLENLKAQISRGGSLFDQVTMRGHVFDLTVKSTFRFVDFGKDFEKYIGIISETDLKKGYGFAGDVETLQLSGFGKYKETTFTDPVATAFHGDIYASEEALRAMRQNSEEVMQEFEQTVRSGVVSKKLRESISMTATQDIENLPDYMRGSAARNREFAMRLQEMLQSGISPQNSPEMINMLYKHYMSQIVRRTDKGFEVAMPDVFRFALSSEANLMPNERAILGKGFERLSFDGASVELAKFRIKGHTLMFSANAIDDLRASLGGFDLDDKGMPRLVTLGAEGQERLGFFMTRQPSGMQEYLVGRAQFDVETVRSIFGEDTRFGRNFIKEAKKYQLEQQNQLASLRVVGHGTTEHGEALVRAGRANRLLSVITGSVENMQEFSATEVDLVEEDIIGILKRMEANKKITVTKIQGQKLRDLVLDAGGAPLRITGQMAEDLGIPPTTRFGTYQLEQATLKSLTESTEKEVIKALQEALPNYANLSQQVKLAITGDESRGISPSLEQFMRHARGDDEVAIINEVFGRLGLSRAASSDDILGVYVNRSMLAGSTRNQIEAISGQLDEAFQAKMLKFSIGLLPQETALDRATTLSVGGMKFSEQQVQQALTASIGRMMDSGSTVTQQAVRDYLGTIKDASGNLVFSGKELNLDTMGSLIARGVGGQIGLSQGAFFAGQVSEKAGIDRALLERVIKRDARNILSGYIEGLTEYGVFGDDATAMMQRAQSALSSDVEEDIQKAARDLIQLSDDSVYAYNSRVTNMGYRIDQHGDIVKRSLRMNTAMDPSLASIGISKESEQIAKNIISKHKDEMDSLFQYFGDEMKILSEDEKMAIQIQKTQLSARIFSEINQVAIEKGQTLSNIADALEYQDIRFFSKMMTLPTLVSDSVPDDDVSNFLESWKKIRQAVIDRQTIRQDQYRAQAASQATRDLHSELTSALGSGRQLNMENLDEAFERLQDLGESVTAMKDILAGRDPSIEIVDPNLSESQIIERTNRARQILNDEAISLRALIRLGGASRVPDVVPIDGFELSDKDMEALFGDPQRPVTNRPKFSKFKDLVKQDSFKNMFTEPIVKRSLYAIGALIAGSLMYTSAKDRTAQDMSGPPLLPGGSAYEQGYPMRIPEIGTYNFGMPVNSGMGVSYNINLSGNRQEVQRAREAIAAMNIGPVNATIYNALPRGNNDPLANFAASY